MGKVSYFYLETLVGYGVGEGTGHRRLPWLYNFFLARVEDIYRGVIFSAAAELHSYRLILKSRV